MADECCGCHSIAGVQCRNVPGGYPGQRGSPREPLRYQAGNQTEVFVASDVSKKVEKAVKDTLAVAVDTWGSSGRFEYWVLGIDRAAAEELASAFCRRRVARGHMTRRDSVSYTHLTLPTKA